MTNSVFPNLFVIGMPRSGTKLLRTLLNNHASIYIPNIETAFIPDLVKEFAGRKLVDADINRAVNDIKSSIFFFYYLKHDGFDFSRLLLKEGCTIYDILKEFYQGLTNESVEEYEYIGDKSPRNIHKTDVLAKKFPEAKFIHIVRDPRDYALSVKSTWGKNELRAVFRWVKGISSFQSTMQSSNVQFLEVRYEDLLTDPESTLKRCTEFLGVSYDPSLVELSSGVENFGDAKGKVIKKDNIAKYKEIMQASRVRAIEDYTVEFLSRYGYSHRSTRESNKAISRFVELMMRPLDVVSLIRFNIQQHGVLGGLNKMRKAKKS